MYTCLYFTCPFLYLEIILGTLKNFKVHLLCETISNSEGGFYPYLRSQRILTVLFTWLSPYKYWINTLFPFEVNLQLIKTLFPSIHAGIQEYVLNKCLIAGLLFLTIYFILILRQSKLQVDCYYSTECFGRIVQNHSCQALVFSRAVCGNNLWM